MYDVPVTEDHTGSSHCLENPLCSACSPPPLAPSTHPFTVPVAVAFPEHPRVESTLCGLSDDFSPPHHLRALRVSLGLVANFSLLLMENRFSTALFSGERSSLFLLQRRMSLGIARAWGAYPLQPASFCACVPRQRPSKTPSWLLQPTGAMWLVPWLFIEPAIWFPIYS